MKTADIAPISLSRRELYDLVWSVPVPEAAARLGISRTWLTKICSRAKVPYPSRAWWALAASGKAPLRARLGQVKVEDVIILRPRGRARPGQFETPGPDDLIDLPDRLTRLHPVLTAWRLEVWHELERSRREPWRRAGAAPATLGKRRMRLLDGLLKALERRGHTIEACPTFSDHLGLMLDRRRVEMLLREDGALIQDPGSHGPSEGEDSVNAKPWLASTPVAALSLEVRIEAVSVQVARWSDQPDARLEDQLADILAAISGMARAPQAAEWPGDNLLGAGLAACDPDALGWLALSRAAASWDAIGRVRRFLASLATSDVQVAPLTAPQATWLAWAEAQVSLREADHTDLDRAMAATLAVMIPQADSASDPTSAYPQDGAVSPNPLPSHASGR